MVLNLDVHTESDQENGKRLCHSVHVQVVEIFLPCSNPPPSQSDKKSTSFTLYIGKKSIMNGTHDCILIS